MMNQASLDLRITVMEEKMQWSENAIHRIDAKIDALQAGQIKLMEMFSEAFLRVEEKISTLQMHTDEKISGLQMRTDERISTLQASTGERFLTLQARTEERFTALQAHTDERFLTLQAHNDAKFIEVHRSMTAQTRWFLSVTLFAATLVPVLFKVLETYF